ncbi:MAG: PAS domain S-box protein [Candidatus Bathyarchaeia archaeon]
MKSTIETSQKPTKKKMHRLRVSKKRASQDKAEDCFEEIEVNHTQFEFFFKNLPVGIALKKIIYDRNHIPVDFITLDVNPQFEKALGLKREHLINRTFAEAYPRIENAPVNWVAVCGRVATTGIPEGFEVHYPNSKSYYFATVHCPKKGYCLSSLMDITEKKRIGQQKLEERKKIEADLEESLEKYRYLLKHAPTAIYEVDYQASKFKSVNDAVCNFLGYSEQELLKMNPLDLLYPESRRLFEQRLQKLSEGKKVNPTVEYRIKAKDGRDLWGVFEVRLLWANGKLHGALVVAHDVTESKKAEEALISAEERYRRLYETTQDGIMARDLEGKMIDCNQAYAKMLGYTKKELKQLTVKQLLPEKWHAQREKITKKVIQTGRSFVFEREYIRKDGSVFPASVRTWRLTDGKGKVIGIWSIVRDISEQKALQKNLEKQAVLLEQIVDERTKQLKDTERLVAIGQTAGMVGHDLRNPLQTLTGELYLAKSDVDSLAPGEAKSNLQESIQVIEEQVGYMDKIVSDLQAFVQPVKIDREPVNLKDLIFHVLETVTVPSNIMVETQFLGHFSQIKADPQLLKRVLINLVTNAVQAMPNGGNINITAQVKPQGQISVTVQDTGVGIPEKIKKQIFTPLFTTKPRGQGFGLAVCKRVIEAHGGSICFESTEGRGAQFQIQFPIS